MNSTASSSSDGEVTEGSSLATTGSNVSEKPSTLGGVHVSLHGGLASALPATLQDQCSRETWNPGVRWGGPLIDSSSPSLHKAHTGVLSSPYALSTHRASHRKSLLSLEGRRESGRLHSSKAPPTPTLSDLPCPAQGPRAAQTHHRLPK